MVTLKQVAVRCGCSIAAVSKALNGKTDIKPETAKRIRETAKEMGYVPNTAARTLKTNTSKVIGLLFFLGDSSIWNQDYFSQIAFSIQKVLDKEGYDIAPVNLSGQNTMGTYEDYCRHRGYDGIFVMSVDNDANQLLAFSDTNIPMVTIDAALPNHSAVLSDNFSGAKELTSYVLARGHRRIALLHGLDTRVTRARIEGFHAACVQAQVDVPPHFIMDTDYGNPDNTALAVRRLMTSDHPPTCILCSDDFAALGAYNEAHSLGLSIPDDISVTGYDGASIAQALRPGLTTLRQDVDGIGTLAAEMLLQVIKKPQEAGCQHVLLPGWIEERGSVKSLIA